MACIRLISVGTRGDLQPYLAILLELRRRGHAVRLIGSPNFRPEAEAHQLEFVALEGDFRDLLGTGPGLQLMQGKPVRLVSDALLRRWLDAARPAIAGSDLLLVTPLTLWAYHLAEAEGCRLAVLSPIPIASTAAFGCLRFPATALRRPRRLQRRLHRLSYRLIGLLKWRQESGVLQAYRTDVLGLPRLPWGGARDRRDPPACVAEPALLHLFSPQVLPVPADWPAQAQATGFCLPAASHERYSPPPELQAFLAAGPPPFYAGFGSMIPADPQRLAAVVVAAAEQAGQRLLLAPGWGRVLPPRALPPSVFVLGDCPHGWLFPQLRGAVHHGGAGTTATTLQCGLPSTVVAFFADQPAWGRTLEQLGVSPATHRQTTITAEALAASLTAIDQEPRYRQRAAELRRALAAEDGVATTANAIEAQLPGGLAAP